MPKLFNRLLCGIIAIALFPVSRAYAEKLYYWFDNDLSHVMQTTLTNGKGALDCSTLGSGIHTLGFYVEENGKVSVPSSRLFYKDVDVDKDGEIIYDIIIDGIHHSSLTRPYANETKLSLDLLNIEKGDHVIEVWATLPGGLTANIAQGSFYHEGVAPSGAISMSFIDNEGNDVSDNVTVSWRNSAGNPLATGNKLSGLAEGDTVYYSFTLPEELGVKYREERSIPVVVKLGETEIVHALKPFNTAVVSGHIHCGDKYLEEAAVSIRQYPNDRYITTFTATTDVEGAFSLELIDAPTRFDVSCEGYIDKYFVVETLNSEDVAPFDIEMEKVGNRSIALNIDYKKSTPDGPVSSSIIPIDYSDVVYSVLNEGEEIIAGVLDRGVIPLPDGITEGTQLEVRVSSATKTFADISGQVIVGEGDVTPLDIVIEEMGAIKMNHDGSGSYCAYLYDDGGSLVTIESYRNGEIAFSPLSEGNYSVVSIAAISGIGAIASIDDFATLGLMPGSDFIVSKAMVAKGYITEISTGAIPEISHDAISTFTSGSEFYVDKTSVIADEYVTGTINLNLSSELLDEVSGAVVMVSLPNGCIYEQGSLIVDGKVTVANISDGKLSFRLNAHQLSSRIRFSVRSEISGDFKANALVSLDMAGNPVCPVGEIAYHVSDYDVYVPRVTADTTIDLSGTATAFGSVEIFDGETKIGEVNADGYGRWSAVAELHNPVNLSSHPIWVRATRNDGFAFRSQPKMCQYDKDHIAPTTVTMINTAHPASALVEMECKSVFSLDGKQQQPKSYYYWPKYPDFTFLIDFTRNDPNVISAVILTVFTESEASIDLPAEYNEEYGKWVTTYAFDENDLPINVDVDYYYSVNSEYNNNSSCDFFSSLNKIQDEQLIIQSWIDESNKAIESGDFDNNNELSALIHRHIGSARLPECSEQIDSIIEELVSVPDSAKYEWISTQIEKVILQPTNPPKSLRISTYQHL